MSEPAADTHEAREPRPSLRRKVPGRLFSFEEKLLGMTLPQFLSDLVAGLLLLTVTNGLPLVPRLLVCALLGGVTLILVHVTFQGYSMLLWLFFRVRFLTLPRRSVFRLSSQTHQPRTRSDAPSVQTCWPTFDHLERGMFSASTSPNKGGSPLVTCWSIVRVETVQNLHLVPEEEQLRFYERIKQFLDGLGTGAAVKFVTVVEQSDPQHDAAFLAERAAAEALAAHPALHQIQSASLSIQQRLLSTCTQTQHYLVLSASSQELAARRAEGDTRSPLSLVGAWMTLSSSLRSRNRRSVTPEQVRDTLRTRLTQAHTLFAQLDVRAEVLEDAEALAAFASCLVPGAALPSFQVRVAPASPASTPANSTVSSAGSQPGSRRWKKSVTGVQGTFGYTSGNAQAHVEPDKVSFADLLAPEAVVVRPDVLAVTVHGTTRYQRYLEVTGYGPDLVCGWQEALTQRGIPMVLATGGEELDTRQMIQKLEFDQLKLASHEIVREKQQRLVKAAQHVHMEQVRGVIEDLERQRYRIDAVQMVIGLHAGSLAVLEQRSAYLLSALRDLHLSARVLTYRQDIGWRFAQLSPVERGLDRFVNLPTSVLASFVEWSTQSIGTAQGVFLGTTGTGASRRPVRWLPWASLESMQRRQGMQSGRSALGNATKKLANGHITVVGMSGMGKSWTVKLLILGLLCQRLADAVVVDRDGDYDALHAFLGKDSQRINLAGFLPLNPFDLPFGEDDLTTEEPTDLLAEFIQNTLLIFLALLYGEALSRAQEAFAAKALRALYARAGITMEALWRDPPATLALPSPTFADFLTVLRELPAANEAARLALLERFESVDYLFPGQTTVSLNTPLTIFNIHTLDEKWYPLMVFVVQHFLNRHRALKRDERYLAYVIEEASYLLKHPAGKRYLENGSRGFRKLGIAQIVVSQHPGDFLEEGQVILANAATNIFLGMEYHAARTLHLNEALERILVEATPGKAVLRIGREVAALDVFEGSPLHRALLTTDPSEQRRLRTRLAQAQQVQQVQQAQQVQQQRSADAGISHQHVALPSAPPPVDTVSAAFQEVHG